MPLYQFHLIDISQYRTELARDHADRVIAEKGNDPRFFRGMLKRMWNSVSGDYYHARALKEGAEQISVH